MQIQDIVVEPNDTGFLLCDLMRPERAIMTFAFLLVAYSKE
jgi:hypothetical protein